MTGRRAVLALPVCACREDAPETIGVAREEPDGTIVLDLTVRGPGRLIGDAQLRYPPSDPHHATVRAHVGPIPPGGFVLVRPFD